MSYSDLWLNPDVPDPFPPATDELMAQWEKKYKIKLPILLKNLYKVKNGGELKDGAIEGVERILGITLDENHPSGLYPATTIQDSLDDCMEAIDEKLSLNTAKIFLIDGDGHYYYAFDFSGKKEPRIISINLKYGVTTYTAFESIGDFLRNKRAVNKVVNLWEHESTQFINQDKRKFKLLISADKGSLISKLKNRLLSLKINPSIKEYIDTRFENNKIVNLSSIEASFWMDLLSEMGVDHSINKPIFSGDFNVTSWRSIFLGFLEEPNITDMARIVFVYYRARYKGYRQDKKELPVLLHRIALQTGNKRSPEEAMTKEVIERSLDNINSFEKQPVPNGGLLRDIHERYKKLKINGVRFE